MDAQNSSLSRILSIAGWLPKYPYLCATQLTGTFVAHKLNYSEIRFLKSARRHRIGTLHSRYVIENYDPISVVQLSETSIQYKWIGEDQRGRELEILADLEESVLTVFHVMPTVFRRKRNV